MGPNAKPKLPHRPCAYPLSACGLTRAEPEVFPDGSVLLRREHLSCWSGCSVKQDLAPLWALVAAVLVALMFFVGLLMPGGVTTVVG